MFKKLSALLLAAVFMLAACAPAATPSTGYSDQAASGSAPAQPVVQTQVVAQVKSPGSAGEAYNTTPATTERLVIKNATVALVVKDPATVVNSISALAEGAEGFVVNSSVTQVSVDAQGNKILSGQISLRVPAAKLNDILAQIKAQAVSVKSENITGEDVTAQYVDLQSQLTNLQAEAEQLQKIMDSATKTDDVLTVYQQLASVQGQIETIKGQMKYYSESAAMSLITVTLEQEWVSQPIQSGSWQPQGVLKSIAEAWVGTYQVAATVLLWGSIYCLPIIVVIGLIGGLLYLVMRRIMGATRKSKKAPVA
jgi:hypothetical protein